MELAMLLILEGALVSFWLLLVCVLGIRNGAQGMVFLYEPDVVKRTLELGLITGEKLRRNEKLYSMLIFLPVLLLPPAAVYFLNGARGFLPLFWQIAVILVGSVLFDRLFIDEFWVGHTKAWDIPGTEDLKPYIPPKTKLKKWFGTMVFFPLLAALEALLISLL
jgi:hypothetical protein